MPLESDLLLERRRLKRRLAFWRAAFVLGAIGVLAAVFTVPEAPPSVLGGQHVGRLSLTGTIREDRRLLRLLEEAGRGSEMRALLVAIDSPGGSVAGGEAFHAAIARVRAAGKPVVAVMGGTAASAGYMVALPAARIFAREATVTGSIGVLMQTTEFSGLLERLGIRAEAITGGRLKDQPSPFRPLTEEGRAALAAVVQDLHAQFIRIVSTGRNLPETEVRALADGRVFTGRQAVGARLVDAIGGEAEARAWLAAEKGVPATLPVREVAETGERQWLSRLLRDARKAVSDERLSLDGLFAIWHPSLH